jgi:excinuclease UvrABC nuclease subunit
MQRHLITDKMSLSHADFLALQRPCVYVVWFKKACLYVGMSNRGLRRLFGTGHTALTLLEELEEQANIPTFDSIEIFWCRNVTTAQLLEKRTIQELKPKLNRGY